MSNRNIIYSGHPLAIANLKLEAEEFQHVVYMPIKEKGDVRPRLPENLRWAWPAVDAVLGHLWGPRCPDLFESWYVYLTVKRSWVEAGTVGNREGWHIDGYGSNGDKNFIWCDAVPAEYMKGTFNLPAGHAECLERLEFLGNLGDRMESAHISRGTLAAHVLYDLGSTIHRCGIARVSGMRTFLKVSVSRDKYDLKGNARNPLLPSTHWPLKDRQGTRNHPTAQPGNGRAEAYRLAFPGVPSDDRMAVREELGLVAPPQESRWDGKFSQAVQGHRKGAVTVIATHGIHKGTQIAQPGTEELHNEGSLS